MVATRTSVKVLPITLHESLQVTKNTIRIALSTVCFLRNLFPDDLFRTKEWCGVNIKVFDQKTIRSPDKNLNAYNLVQLLEKGIFDALEKGYIERLLVNILDKDPKVCPDARALECYAFKFGEEYLVGSQGHASGKTKDEIVSDTRSLIKRLVMLTGALNPLPQTTWLTINIIYNSKVPSMYEPPLMESVSRISLPHFSQSPLTIKIGELDTGYNSFVLKLRRPDEELGEKNVPNNVPCLDKAKREAADAKSEDLTYDSDYEKIKELERNKDDDDATVTSDDGYNNPSRWDYQPCLNAPRDEHSEHTQVVPYEIPAPASDHQSVTLKQKESLYQAFKSIVESNPLRDPRELLNESDLGGVLNVETKTQFLARIKDCLPKRECKKDISKTRRPLESVENL